MTKGSLASRVLKDFFFVLRPIDVEQLNRLTFLPPTAQLARKSLSAEYGAAAPALITDGLLSALARLRHRTHPHSPRHPRPRPPRPPPADRPDTHPTRSAAARVTRGVQLFYTAVDYVTPVELDRRGDLRRQLPACSYWNNAKAGRARGGAATRIRIKSGASTDIERRNNIWIAVDSAIGRNKTGKNSFDVQAGGDTDESCKHETDGGLERYGSGVTRGGGGRQYLTLDVHETNDQRRNYVKLMIESVSFMTLKLRHGDELCRRARLGRRNFDIINDIASIVIS
ncbi:hypothetical protein EVAR_59119_1 [Eumeta japonica]|uniref:Uncharacterized protein n=1 Tax=Eumeta variegata TaxID=151549 RepID=A0A4C1ZJ88_EUMVA|nr:hypothetical protein EVAR_59119_1 [Eumeta japonica]